MQVGIHVKDIGQSHRVGAIGCRPCFLGMFVTQDQLGAGVSAVRFNAAMDFLPANAKRVITWPAKPFGCPSMFDTYQEVLRYRITPELAEQITTPALVADPDNEGYFAGQPQRLYEMLPGEKELVRFTETEGAAGHCQPMARALAAQRFFDFLDERIGLNAFTLGTGSEQSRFSQSRLA
ncbi:hypothetical protein [Mycolicibacterium helvum]|uniref:Alpha/beta hydrolase n=1 Tax=Mycolicibacterium helvum TaxID=1534349 RepID=A0A7I7SYP3_9MYCO|nr:hypothetical protein [Mycolicibacterium helvum]BBY62137.1 hypothetical protein MHEL_03800 [Mycolicibacterium helvum]